MTVSCSSDLDFDQVNDLQLTPAFVTNLSNFDIPANEFVTSGVEQTVLLDIPTIDIFNKTFFANNVNKAELFFEFNNTINRGYSIDIVLLNVNNVPLNNIHFDIPPYSGVGNLVTRTEVFTNSRLNLLKNTTKIAFVITMLSGPPLSESSLGNLKMRSSATAYFSY